MSIQHSEPGERYACTHMHAHTLTHTLPLGSTVLGRFLLIEGWVTKHCMKQILCLLLKGESQQKEAGTETNPKGQSLLSVRITKHDGNSTQWGHASLELPSPVVHIKLHKQPARFLSVVLAET